MMRLLWVAMVAVPGTILYVLRILWAVYRDAPDAACVCDWVPRKWAQLLLRASGVRVVLENEGSIDDEVPQVLIANHTSWFDVLALAAFTPGRYVFVAKKEVEDIPFFGRAVRACGHIYIDRQDHQKALASLDDARRRLEEERPTVIMFPEGTRSPTGELQRFKKGAFVLALQTGADLVPVGIHGSRGIMRKDSWRIRPGTITIRFGEPIDIGRFEIGQRNELITEARGAMMRLLEPPIQSTH